MIDGDKPVITDNYGMFHSVVRRSLTRSAPTTDFRATIGDVLDRQLARAGEARLLPPLPRRAASPRPGMRGGIGPDRGNAALTASAGQRALLIFFRGRRLTDGAGGLLVWQRCRNL
jgi:hypothetical protein